MKPPPPVTRTLLPPPGAPGPSPLLLTSRSGTMAAGYQGRRCARVGSRYPAARDGAGGDTPRRPGADQAHRPRRPAWLLPRDLPPQRVRRARHRRRVRPGQPLAVAARGRAWDALPGRARDVEAGPLRARVDRGRPRGPAARV